MATKYCTDIWIYKESLVMVIFLKPSRIEGFLERTGIDRSGSLVVGSLLLFKSIERIMGIYQKPRSLNFRELLWWWVLRATLITMTDLFLLFLITIQHLVVTSVEWVPEWNPSILDSSSRTSLGWFFYHPRKTSNIPVPDW